MTAILCMVWWLSAGVDEEIRFYDEVRLKNGQVLTGLIKDDTDPAELKMALLRGDGTVKDLVGVPRSTIQEIVPRRTPPQIYKNQVRKRDLMDARQAFELAEWCATEEANLYGEATVLAHRALRLMPDLREAYPLLAALNARKELAALSAEEADRELELVMLARERGIFLAGAYLRAAQVLLDQSKDAWSVFTDEAVSLLAEVRRKGEPGEAAAATEALSNVYLAWGKLDELLELNPPEKQGGAPAEAPKTVTAKLFSLVFPPRRGDLPAATAPEAIVARLLMRGTAEDLQKATSLLARIPDGGGKKIIEASLAWSRGDAPATEKLLLEALELTKSPQAALALAIVLALEGKTKTAAEIARIVAPQGADGALLSYVLGKPEALDAFMSAHGTLPGARLLGAEDKLRRGDATEAGTVVSGLLADASLSPAARALAWPLGAKASARAGATDEAVQRLLCARAALPGEGRIALALAALAGYRKNAYEARKYLDEARRRNVPASEAALLDAYVTYGEGNLVAASRLLDKLAADTTLSAGNKAYVARLQRAAWEATRLQTWEDTFQRADGGDVLNSWNEEEKYGIKIALAGNRVTCAGVQEGDADACTFLYVYTEYGRLFRASFRVRPQRDDMAFGIRIAEGTKSARIEAVPGGTYALIVPGTRSEKTDALRFTWKRGAWQTITLELPAKGKPIVDVDGQRAELPQTLLFAKNANVKLGVFVRGARQGAEVELDVSDAKLWRLSDEEVKKGKRG